MRGQRENEGLFCADETPRLNAAASVHVCVFVLLGESPGREISRENFRENGKSIGTVDRQMGVRNLP